MATRPTTGDGEGCDTIGPTCRLVVVAPIDGSPAERAGLRSGDIVTAVDGRPVDGETLDEAIARIRGPKGTRSCSRSSATAKSLDLSIVRDTIVQRQVETRELADGAVRTCGSPGFSDNSARQFEDAVRAARERGVTKFVVDLRDNPGGFVTAARTIASQFIDEGPIFWEEAADGIAGRHERRGRRAATGPTSALRCSSTAARPRRARSSRAPSRTPSEARSSARRRSARARSSSGSTSPPSRAASVSTIARWLTPDKRWIHQDGLAPDVVSRPTGPRPPSPAHRRSVHRRGARRPRRARGGAAPAAPRLAAASATGSRSPRRATRHARCPCTSCAIPPRPVRFARPKGGDVQ